MKGILCWVCALVLGVGQLWAERDLNREARMIRRAFLDTVGVIPSSEEIEWYLVYNQNGYSLAVAYLVQNGPLNGLDAQRLLSEEYREQPDRPIEREVLERNVIYLAGMGRKEVTPELFESACARLIEDALRVADGRVSEAIDYLVNTLTCRNATVVEVNTMVGIYKQVILKSEEAVAWRTVLSHVLEMHDCKSK